jgi:hypothetical protein
MATLALTPAGSTTVGPRSTEALAARCDRATPEQAIAIASASAFTKRYPRQPFGWSILAESHYRARDYPSAVTAAE